MKLYDRIDACVWDQVFIRSYRRIATHVDILVGYYVFQRPRDRVYTRAHDRVIARTFEEINR
jgi:hypothetical protein